jgi:hypothetical protein
MTANGSGDAMAPEGASNWYRFCGVDPRYSGGARPFCTSRAAIKIFLAVTLAKSITRGKTQFQTR